MLGPERKTQWTLCVYICIELLFGKVNKMLFLKKTKSLIVARLEFLPALSITIGRVG